MAKKKAKKASPLAALIFIVMCVLLILNFCLPLLTTQGSNILTGKGNKVGHDLFELLDNNSDSDNSTVKAFLAFSLISAIVGCLGALFSAFCIVKPKFSKWLKLAGVAVAVVAIVTFVLAIVVANDHSLSGSVFGYELASITTTISIAPILTLVGGLGALVTPWIIK